MYEILSTLLPEGMTLSDYSDARVADNPGRWVSFTLSNGSLSAPATCSSGRSTPMATPPTACLPCAP
ncbi:hypothetical protein G7085_18435 [Tessaracoccus sp. HDW20]|uniref:hypothetical protein n=1 Tax=Tessaracoccus coleopterorum TaxID=2714950 RepID=UPI0018D4A76D|nr:hypothetical protein [Tessaracoccus coleopterorum]NHB85866.1 hypothetical protein [Tessaracoccus coleopterorum]